MSRRFYPALEIVWPTAPDPEQVDRLLAALDDEGPTAVDERESGFAVFFPSAERRDRAATIARTFAPDATVAAVSVSDDAWAERSQASLTAVRVGRIVVTPPWTRDSIAPRSDDDIVVTIVPSMGFGTGHHASTRLCLLLLQGLDVAGRSVLDVGTGSGVLAIAAWRVGATPIVGIDLDADALASARENVDMNGAQAAIELRLLDLAETARACANTFDLVMANLTGTMIERFSDELHAIVSRQGALIVSGFQLDEEAGVRHALEAGTAARVSSRVEEDGWVAMRLTLT
jgi:ribosomal protein L11 methyltransferase